MTRPSLLESMMRRSRPTVLRLGALVVGVVLLAGCTGGDDDGSTSDQGADVIEGSTADGDAASADEGCEDTEATTDIEFRSLDGLTDLEQQTVQLFRDGSIPFLTAPNPISCRGFIEAPTRIDAAELGAFEAKTLVHTDPEVSYDLVYFAAPQAPDQAVPGAITEQLSADAGERVDVWSVGGTLFIATTAPADDETASEIIAHYDGILAGEE